MYSFNSFRINPVSGVITVRHCYKPGTCIDYERQPGKRYRLTVTAEDEGGEGFQVQVPLIINIIDANDNKPVFSQTEYGTTIRENQTTFEPLLFVAVRNIISFYTKLLTILRLF